MSEHEFRGAHFETERSGRFRWYVQEIKLPWHEGTLIALTHEAGWFGLTERAVIRRAQKSINRQFRRREWNGQSTERGADAVDWPAW